MNIRFLKTWIAIIISIQMVLSACGGVGKSEKSGSGSAFSGKKSDIQGSIVGQYGGQSEKTAWLVVLLDKSTSICKVGEVDRAGLFTFKSVDVSKTYTIILLSPNYIVSAVLSIPPNQAGVIKQYFKLNKTWLPQLIHKGPIVNFQNFTGITIQNDKAADEDSDGIPDGSSSLTPMLWDQLASGFHLNLADEERERTGDGYGLLSVEKVDTDQDGLANEDDPDIDGDGIPNVFDPDDDGDGTKDVFDADENGNNVIDSTETNPDVYFKEGVEFIVAQLEKIPEKSGTMKTTIKMTLKLRNNVEPVGVRVRGPSYLKNSLVETVDDSETTISNAFDMRLLDDGQNEDGGIGDNLYARRITLPSGQTPKANQVIFFQLAFGSQDDPYFLEYPYTFPDITLSDMTPKYNADARMFSLAGNPFGEGQTEFTWTVKVYDADAQVIIESPAIEGSTRNWIMPSNILNSGETYTYAIVAQLMDRVPGYPAYTVRTVQKEITAN